MLVALPFVALMLTGCGTDIQTPENDGQTETATETEVGQTVFSTYDDGTRTSIDTGRNFYWETGDNIWVNNGGTYIKSASTDITGKADKANFTFNATLDDPVGYEVLYTGQNSPEASLATTDALHVTIADQQTQSAWNDATHIGTSGDCGVATAYRSGEGYRFKLLHQASYLVLMPYLSSIVRDDENCRLTKIEIVAARNDTIAGTYNFDINGIDTLATSVTSPSDTIKINCTNGFALTKTSSNACFAVIQPGNHKLTIKYHVTSQATGRSFIFVKDAFTKDFSVNGVTTIRHELKPIVVTLGNLYAWGATTPWTTSNATTSSSPILGGDVTNSIWNSVPNANEMYWLLVHGDPHHDTTTPWIPNIGSYMFIGAAWIKNKSTINAEGHTIHGHIGKNNADMRQLTTDFSSTLRQTAIYVQTIASGRPDDYQKYVFLAMQVGYRDLTNIAQMGGGVGSGCYWLRTSVRSTPATANKCGCYFNIYDDDSASILFGIPSPMAVIRSHFKGHGCYIDPIKQLMN